MSGITYWKASRIHRSWHLSIRLAFLVRGYMEGATLTFQGDSNKVVLWLISLASFRKDLRFSHHLIPLVVRKSFLCLVSLLPQFNNQQIPREQIH